MSDTDRKKRKSWPVLRSDEEAERFVAEADLTEYDWSQMRPVHYEFADKNARVTMRIPERLVDDIKAEAEKRGVKYQRFMRELMERGLQSLSR